MYVELSRRDSVFPSGWVCDIPLLCAITIHLSHFGKDLHRKPCLSVTPACRVSMRERQASTVTQESPAFGPSPGSGRTEVVLQAFPLPLYRDNMPLPGLACVQSLAAVLLIALPTPATPVAAQALVTTETLSLQNFIVFVPTILTVVALFRTSLTKVFLNIYLPVLLLFPLYFHIKVPGLPPIDFSEAVAIPLGCAMLYRLWPFFKLTVSDVAMAVFIASAGVSHFLAHDTTHGIFNIFYGIFEALIPYLFGKLLIEHFDIRVETVRRIVVLMAAGCIISVLEYFIGVNPFASAFQPFFPGQKLIWVTQFRWGFGRVAGPYGQSELAGIMLFTGIVLLVWVSHAYPWKEKLGSLLKLRTVLFAVLGITLLSTQARGPWLGCLLALPIALLGRTRNLLRNALVLVALCLVAGLVLYVKGKAYTSTNPSSGEQQTAQYRADLIDFYVPIAQRGGAWGWGEGFPVVRAYSSVDNEYLLLWLVQGWVGMVSFVVIAADTVYRLIVAVVRSTGKRDRFFALTLLGCFCGLLLTVGTVFLFGQPFQLFFLLAGWAQSVKTARVPQQQRQFAFAHAIT